ncbi:MAG: RIP metalloprotease RseP [Verrucomicrobia bacterium]|nr:RIP metalloprotease RseP [Verrucomicrobiota bacterium]
MVIEIFGNIGVVLALLVFFGLSIFIHELGHFIVARWCGLVVETFAIGFGPSIWKKRINGVTYKIGIFPIGGYVALPQLDPSGMSTVQGRNSSADVAEGNAQASPSPALLPRIEPWKKILVSIAGAAGNIILAIVLAWIVYLVGMPAGPAERNAVVGFVMPDSEAYAQGLRTGDQITSANGMAVRKWVDFRLESALGDSVTIEAVGPDGKEKSMRLMTSKGGLGEQTVSGVVEQTLCVVMSVAPGMSADKAGLKSGDTITHLAGEKVQGRSHLVYLVNAFKDQRIPISFKRVIDGKIIVVDSFVTPEFDPKEDIVRIGIQWNLAAVDYDTVIHPKPMDQIREHSSAISRFLGALVTPQKAKAASAAMGGPVAIMASYWYIVKASIMLAVWFTGFLNVNLAMLNLLPIPVLDGGHICFSLWEWVAGRPAHAKVVNILVNGFAFLLIGVIILLSVRDVDRFTPVGGYIRDMFVSDASAPTNGLGAMDLPTPDPVPAD